MDAKTLRPNELVKKSPIGSLILASLLSGGVCFGFVSTRVTQSQMESLVRGEVIVNRLPTADAGVMAGRVMGIIDAPVDKVWSVIDDWNRIHEFRTNMSVTFLVDRTALDEISKKTHWDRKKLEEVLYRYKIPKAETRVVYFYNVFDMPFPLADQWSLLEMERDSQKHTVQWHLLVGNMRTSDGSWELRPVGEDSAQTLTIYTVSSDPGIPIPAPLIKVALDNTLPDVIHGLRKRVKELSAKE